jgi:hypothetical protein
MGTGQNEWFTPADYVELARRNRFLIRANLQKFFWGGWVLGTEQGGKPTPVSTFQAR